MIAVEHVVTEHVVYNWPATIVIVAIIAAAVVWHYISRKHPDPWWTYRDDPPEVDEEVEERYRAALSQIATEDYRGPEPDSRRIAREALEPDGHDDREPG